MHGSKVKTVKLNVIDKDGFRPNVGIIIFNDEGQLLWAKRLGQGAWQFPQGGINEDESPEQALIRELNEEVGLNAEDIDIVACTKDWLHYRLPSQYVRQHSHPLCIGQKQKWFLLRMKGDVAKINFNQSDTPEFEDWRWVSYWYPLNQVIDFKRDVYRKALLELQKPLSQVLIEY